MQRLWKNAYERCLTGFTFLYISLHTKTFDVYRIPNPKYGCRTYLYLGLYPKTLDVGSITLNTDVGESTLLGSDPQEASEQKKTGKDKALRYKVMRSLTPP